MPTRSTENTDSHQGRAGLLEPVSPKASPAPAEPAAGPPRQGGAPGAARPDRERHELRDSHGDCALLDAFFQATTAGLGVIDRDLRVVRLNQALADINGIPLEEHLGRPISELLPEMGDAIVAPLRRVLETGEAMTAEVTGRTRASDQPRAWIVNYAPVRSKDGHVVGVGTVVLDITERKQAENRLQEEGETLELLNRAGKLLAAELDLEKLVQAVTDAATRLSGAQFGAFFYNVTNAEGKSYTLYTISGVSRDHFSGFPMPRNTDVFAPTFNGEGVVRLDDVTKDARYGNNAPYHGMPKGHLPVVSYLAVPVISRSGSVIGGLFFGHPAPGVFTERAERLVVGLAAQAAIAMDNAHLFRRAQHLIEALERSNKELDRFAYVASHDLKAPLRAIANLSQWIEDDLADKATPETRQHMDLLRSRVVRLEALIDGILRYSRAGRVRDKPETVEVRKLLDEVLALLTVPPGASIEIAAGMPALFTERVPLEQVFMNLIGNALKYADRPDARVEVRGRDLGDLWEFSVKDNGPGIAPQFHQKVWEIFQTLNPRDNIEGTGIGLSIVQKIVLSKGGRAWVESDKGAGATFFFTWPRTESDAASSVR
ncbi:PAS domain-containing protein [Sorangium sp. So ce1151]|uniref:PAS domain-containing protein n=1 Tax=Sorangium sp. So ce1151 TaxID=3133332 RepID=UPI003F624385